MSESEEKRLNRTGAEETYAARKPYQKPEFRFEQVFETRALACGKISSTQAQCASNTKTS
jgi:hypothetical protein